MIRICWPIESREPTETVDAGIKLDDTSGAIFRTMQPCRQEV
jgi:hypothetical protein